MLVRVATREGVIEPTDIEPLLAAGIISMFLTPLFLQMAPHITAGERLLAPLAKLLRVQGIVALGASRVVAKEIEGGVDVLSQVMRVLDVPLNVIEEEIRTARDSMKGTHANLPRLSET